MSNPLIQFRAAHGLSRPELALATGIPYNALWRAEAGYPRKLEPNLVRFLVESGYQGDPQADYRGWREELGNTVRKEHRLAG